QREVGRVRTVGDRQRAAIKAAGGKHYRRRRGEGDVTQVDRLSDTGRGSKGENRPGERLRVFELKDAAVAPEDDRVHWGLTLDVHQSAIDRLHTREAARLDNLQPPGHDARKLA